MLYTVFVARNILKSIIKINYNNKVFSEIFDKVFVCYMKQVKCVFISSVAVKNKYENRLNIVK